MPKPTVQSIIRELSTRLVQLQAFAPGTQPRTLWAAIKALRVCLVLLSRLEPAAATQEVLP